MEQSSKELAAVAEAKCEWIRTEHGERFLKLLTEAREMVSERFPAPAGVRAQRMIAIADEMGSVVAKQSICREGCSHCCNQSVVITKWEAQRIQKFSGRNLDDNAGFTEQSQVDGVQEKYMGVPCTFLKDDRCTIYPVRPMACRTLYSMADDPELCNLKKNPRGKIPFFNFQSLQLSSAGLWLDEPFEDIRAFFPEAP